MFEKSYLKTDNLLIISPIFIKSLSKKYKKLPIGILKVEKESLEIQLL